jgi:hypothetical protein
MVGATILNQGDFTAQHVSKQQLMVGPLDFGLEANLHP